MLGIEGRVGVVEVCLQVIIHSETKNKMHESCFWNIYINIGLTTVNQP